MFADPVCRGTGYANRRRTRSHSREGWNDSPHRAGRNASGRHTREGGNPWGLYRTHMR